MGNLTKNLSRSEFKCSCGCGFDTVDVDTVRVIQEVCDHFDCSVRVTSGCRCAAHNASVGGTKNSQHLRGRAADCQFIYDGSPIDPETIYQYLISEYDREYGFGLYSTFNHIDTRSGKPARWGDS